jgi:cellulose synthase/poly-beta-1,6-N-acetylglucosamine synthase-like glycosyltransferase/peptidoglycan/xylan/chitin deacetylase (PgdA/CDA1 family)
VGGRGRSQEPHNHWLVLLLFGIAVFSALLLQGFSEGVRSSERPGDARPAAAVPRGAPVLDLTGDRARSRHAPAGTVALTFNGGPDPRWTPRLLEVLAKHDAEATFFAVGAEVARHPGLTRRLVRAGHEVGSLGYTNSDLGAMPSWRRRLELDLTQHALAGAAGVHTRLVRLPHVVGSDDVRGNTRRAAAEAARRGNLLVLADLDSRTATEGGAAGVVDATTPSGGEGAVVALPGAGIDMATTTVALDRLLDRLSGEGYRVTTVSAALRAPPAAVPVTTGERVVGKGLVLAQQGAKLVSDALVFLFGVAAVFLSARVLLLLLFARVHLFRLWRERRLRRRRERAWKRLHMWRPDGPDPPPVSVVVPAYNEAANIVATVDSLVNTAYQGNLEVIVVDDGSTDDTAGLVERLRLPEVRVVRRPNGGKPAALNTGLHYARFEAVVFVDADTVFQPDTIGRLVAPLTNPRVGAVSGNTKVANRKGLLGRWQHIEYVMGFNLDRRMYDVLKCMPTVPGAIGAFRRTAIDQVGGITDDTLAEDTDLTMALCRAGWLVRYEESAVAWTEVPSTLRQLWRQRYRWCYGTMQAMWKHKRALVQRGPSGRFGRRGLPYLALFHVLLPLCAPAVDLLAVYGVFVLDPVRVVSAWLAFSAVQVVAGRSALWLDGESTWAIWTLPLQQVVYRQLTYLVVIQSLVTAAMGARLPWQPIRRTGTFTTPQRAS